MVLAAVPEGKEGAVPEGTECRTNHDCAQGIRHSFKPCKYRELDGKYGKYCTACKWMNGQKDDSCGAGYKCWLAICVKRGEKPCIKLGAYCSVTSFGAKCCEDTKCDDYPHGKCVRK